MINLTFVQLNHSINFKLWENLAKLCILTKVEFTFLNFSIIKETLKSNKLSKN